MAARNVSFTVGLRQMFYLISPNESSFKRVEDVPDYLDEAFPFFNGAVLLEFIIALLKGTQTFRLNDGLSSFSAGVLQQVLKFLTLSLKLVFHTWVYTNWRIVELPWNSPLTWWIAFLAMDFAYYWFHRAAHEINLIWAAHQVHHSSEDYNLTTALRQSVVQHYFNLIVYAPLGLILPPSVFFVHVQFNLIYQFWIHTELIKSLGPLEYIINTPSHHRVHHGRNPYCIDKNYGGALIIWDRLFGTFQGETDEKVVYGLVHPVNSWNPIWIQICHYVHVVKTFWNIEGIKNKIEYPVQKYDSSLPLWGCVYTIVHFIIFNEVFQQLSATHKNLTEANVLGVVMFMIFSVTTFGSLMDRKWYAPYMEVFRCIAFLVVDYLLSLRQLSVNVVPSSMLGATRVIYVVSVFIWFLLCCRSGKILDKED